MDVSEKNGLTQEKNAFQYEMIGNRNIVTKQWI